MKSKKFSMKEKGIRFWHYTVAPHMLKIILQKVIKPSPVYVRGECSAVWISTNQDWEEMVRKKGFNDRRKEMYEMGCTPVRIEINPKMVDLIPWRQFKKESGITPFFANGYEKVDREWGANPKEWFASYKPIPLSSCNLPPQYWNGNEWIEQGDIPIIIKNKVYFASFDELLKAKIVGIEGSVWDVQIKIKYEETIQYH